MKKVPFYSYLVNPVRCIGDITNVGLVTHTNGFFPLTDNLPFVKHLRKKRIYLVGIKSYQAFPIAGIPSYLKQYGLQMCVNAPHYLGGLPPEVKEHSKEFDDKYIVALGYPDGIEFAPLDLERRNFSGPLGLMFREPFGVSLTLVNSIYEDFKNGRCIIIAEKLRS